MALVVSSTTDSQEAVNAAAGIVEETEEKQEKAQYPATRPKPEPVEPDDNGEEDEEEPDEQEDIAETPRGEQKPKPRAEAKKGGFQRKIERLIAQNEMREQRIRELEAERQRYAPPSIEQPRQQPQGPPRPEDFPNDYEAYNRATIRYEARQELESELKARMEAQRQEQQARAQREIDDRWHKGVGALRKEAADFEEALESVAHIPVPPYLQMAIKRDPNGARLAYELARHPEEFEQIVSIEDPLEAISALGEFRGSMKAANAATTPRPQKVASEAPPPIRPVGQSAGNGTRVTRPLDELPYQDYKRAREREIKARKAR